MDERPAPERTRRDGVRALPVTLADGDDWGLALPSTRFRPTVEEGVDDLGRPTEVVRVSAEFGHPLAIRRLTDRLRSAREADDPARSYEALFDLAAALIRRAHDVDLATAASLLELDVADLPRLVEAVLAALGGEPPEAAETPRKAQPDV